MNAKETLIKAKALIQNPENWTQGCSAVDNFGEEVSPSSPEACKFCALGALDKMNDWDAGAFKELAKVARSKYNTCVSQVNDKLGHSAVMEIFDIAIAQPPMEVAGN